MSTVLAYRTEEYSVLITDTRITNFNEDGGMKFNDKGVKMYYVQDKGFITGVGIGELLINMYNNIISNNNLDIYRPILRNAFLSAYAKIRNKHDTQSEFIEVLDRTGIYTSWNDEEYNLRLFCKNLIDLGSKEAFADLKKNNLAILYPDDIDKNKSKELLNENNRILHGDIDDIVRIMLEIFKQISNLSDYVSDIACIGIIKKDIEEPLYYEDKIDNIKNVFEDILSFDDLVNNNQFLEYKDKLTRTNL